MVPNKFFVVSGKAASPVSDLNAFDLALKEAGIAHCNLVKVSSILPKDAQEIHIERSEIENVLKPGAITFCVLARMDGKQGESIGAGIAWASGKKHGIVAEDYGYRDKAGIEEQLEWKLKEMSKIRELGITTYNTKTETMKVEDRYGCVLAVLVLLTE